MWLGKNNNKLSITLTTCRRCLSIVVRSVAWRRYAWLLLYIWLSSDVRPYPCETTIWNTPSLTLPFVSVPTEFSIYRGEYGSGDCSCGLTCLPLDIFVIILYSWSRLGHMIVRHTSNISTRWRLSQLPICTTETIYTTETNIYNKNQYIQQKPLSPPLRPSTQQPKLSLHPWASKTSISSLVANFTRTPSIMRRSL